MGFPTPLRQWLRTNEAAPILDSLLDPEGIIASSLNMDAVKELIVHHRGGAQDGTDRLWNLLNLQIWGDTFITGRRARTEDAFSREVLTSSS
jgi:hypothetical protein